jgi:hypothetical protein
VWIYPCKSQGKLAALDCMQEHKMLAKETQIFSKGLHFSWYISRRDASREF